MAVCSSPTLHLQAWHSSSSTSDNSTAYMYHRTPVCQHTWVRLCCRAPTCRLTLVVDTFGVKLQPFHRFLLSALSAFRVTTLSHMSSRMPLSRPERYNPDGQHVRCFR